MNLFEIDKKYTELFVNTIDQKTGEVIGEHLDVEALQDNGLKDAGKLEPGRIITIKLIRRN